MVIDSHQHFIIPEELQNQKNEESGIDKAILFSAIPHPERANNLQEICSEMNVLNSILSGENAQKKSKNLMRDNIQSIQNRIEKYPQKYLGFAPVMLGMSLDETSAWIEDVVKKGFKGLGEFTPGNAEQVSLLETVFRAADQFNKLPIWIHTFSPVTIDGLQILMGLCKKYPKVPTVFGHLGGINWIEAIEFAKTNNQVYLDLSGTFTSLAVKSAISELPNRCLFSSDAPYGEPFLQKRMVEFLSPSRITAEMVLGGNISELLQK